MFDKVSFRQLLTASYITWYSVTSISGHTHNSLRQAWSLGLEPVSIRCFRTSQSQKILEGLGLELKIRNLGLVSASSRLRLGITASHDVFSLLYVLSGPSHFQNSQLTW